MAVNYGLLEPVDIAGQFMAGRQQAQQNQLAKQQNEMRQQEFGMRQQEFATQAEDRRLKMDRANERNDFLTKLSDQMQQGGHKLTRETLSSMMNFGLKSNEESLVNLATKGLQALDEQDQFQSEMGKFAPKAPATQIQPGALGSGTFDVNAPAASTNALAPAPVAAPSTNAMVGGYSRPQVEQMLTSQNARVRDMGKNLFAALPKEVAPKEPPVSIAEFNLAQKDPEFMRFLQARSAANRAPAAPRPEAAPVAVVDPATGKQIYVTRDQSFGMTPATSTEGLSTKEIQKREAVLPQARQSVKTVGNTMSVIDETVDRLLANPDGLNGITGTIYGRTPAFTEAANTANADLEQLRNLAFVQGLTELRAASKTGAGVGNVSNREGERFENLKASLDRRQSKTDLENALRRLKEQAAFTRQTMQEAFDETYQYKQTAPAAAAPAVSGLNVVVTPDGQSHTFQTPAAAAQFKKAAGIK
jgi:hypothetical protein